MDEQKKQVVSIGKLPSIRMAKGKGASAQNPLIRHSTMMVQRPLKTAPLLEGSKPTTGNDKSGLLTLKILLGDLLETTRHYPKTWIGSKDGKIYICIEPDTGKLTLVHGKLYLDGVPVDTILEAGAIPQKEAK